MSPPIFRMNPGRIGLRPAWILALLLISLGASARPLHFTLPGLNGQAVQLADFRGRWVVDNFWASWCAPCLLEMPELQTFHEQHADRATVIGVNFENLPASELRLFTERLGVTFPIALSMAKPVPGFAVQGLPTTFLIDPSGTLVDTHLGSINAAMLAARIAAPAAARSTP